MQVAKKVAEAERYLRSRIGEPPLRAIVLERRMRGFSNELSALTVVEQRLIPGLPEPRQGDAGGVLLFGRLDGVPTAVVEGRTHLYDGYLPGECGCMIRALAALGARLFLAVADGSALGEGVAPGTMFLATDRIDMTGVPHLKGVHNAPGGVFPEVTPIPPEVVSLAASAGEAAGITLVSGVAALVHGPLRPSPAERRMFRLLGADALTMALAPEMAATAYAGVPAAAFLVLDGGWDKALLDFCRIVLRGWAIPENKMWAPGQAPRLDVITAPA